MYFFLTNKCKMECDHCCVNASPRGRKVMQNDVFYAGLRFAEERGESVFLGGGEPTDHPKFMQYLAEMLASDLELELCGVITNGTNDREAKLLSNLRGTIYTAISLDPYHPRCMVSDAVLDMMFTDKRETVNVQNTGRGANVYGAGNGCTCPDLWLDCNGDLYQCGCRKKKLGNIITSPEKIDAKLSDLEPYECSEEK